MKRLSITKKSISILLAILVALSSFSVIGVTAATTDKTATSATTDKVKTEKKDSKGNTTYKIWSDKSYCLRFIESEFPYTFTNQINGKKITYPQSWGAVEYEYAHNTENNKNTTVWCIQPGVVINGDDYYFEDKGVNADYWKKLNNSKHKKIKKALAATFAYAKANGGTSKSSPYYYAALLLDWDYVQGIRNVSAPYSVKNGKKSNIYKIKNTYSKERVTAVQNAAKDILSLMNDEKKPLDKLLNNGRKNTRLYEDISKAKKDRTDSNHNVRLPLDKTNGKYTATSQAKFTSLKTYKDEIKLTVVNHNDNNTDYINQHISASLTAKGKIKVTSDVNLADREKNNGVTYYVRITKTPKGYTKGSDKVYQSKSNDKQTMVDMAYKADNTIAYFPIYQSKIENYGTLIINKDVTSTADGFSGDALLGGWTFKLTNDKNNKVNILVTDDEGSTQPITDIPLGTTYTITELGLEIHPGDDNINDYYNVTTFNGKTYGMPNDIKDKTTNSTINNVKTKKVTVTSYSSVTEVNWENEKEVNFKIRIRKKNSDGDDPSGYFFYVWDYGTAADGPHDTFKKTIEKPQIVGPTDEEGYAEFKLDNISSVSLARSQLILVELGKLKTGYSLPPTKYLDSWMDMVIDNETGTSKARERFKIPEKYKIVFEPAFHNATSLYDGVSLPIYRNDIKEFQNNPTNFTKEFTFVNEAEGKIKLKKKCAVTGKELGEAVYGIYEYGQGNPEDNYVGENGSGDEYYEEEEETQGVTEAISPTSTISDENIVTEPIVQDETDPIGEEGNSDVSNNTDESAKLLDTITTKKGEWVYSKLLPCGTYYIQEIKAPNNKYALDETKYTFTIKPGTNTDETALPITRTDKPTNVEFKKIDGKTVKGNSTANAKLLAGAKINFYEKPESGKIDYKTAPVVYSIDSTSSSKPESIVSVFELGKTYIAHEVSAPKGYFLADDYEFTVPTDGSKDEVEFVDDPMTLSVSKIDIADGAELPGCKIKITGKNGIVEEWTSGNTPHEVDCSKFIEGESYTITETSPKDGYTQAESKTFKVVKGMPTKITMEDDRTKLRFSKQGTTESEGIATTAEVPGCKITVTEVDGTVVEEWISTDKPHIIEGKLKINTDYYMNEISAAPGWKIAEPVKFHVDNTGNVQDVVMVDEPQPAVYFSKKSITGSEELEGCKLEVRDSNNKIVDEWISKKEPHIIDNLTPGETYSMIETQPVDGYTTAETITFTVPKAPTALTISMKDKPTVVEFSKTSITGSKEIPGCKLKITDENGNTLYHWTSTNKPHIIKGKLAINKTYYLVETQPADGYTTAERVKFTVKDTGEIQKVQMKDAPTVIKIQKVAKHDTKLLLGGAKFKIVDVKSKKVVYRFTTKAGKPYTIKGKLAVGRKYRLEEVKAPVGYRKAVSKTFVVKDSPKAQTYTVKDAINIRFEVPQTGGLSEHINYILISILFALGLGIVGILIYKRKKTASK